MSTKKFIRGFDSVTGSLHSQPSGKQVTMAASCFTSDYEHHISLCGALDAPDSTPSGAVKAYDGAELVIGFSHVWRPGALGANE